MTGVQGQEESVTHKEGKSESAVPSGRCTIKEVRSIDMAVKRQSFALPSSTSALPAARPSLQGTKMVLLHRTAAGCRKFE